MFRRRVSAVITVVACVLAAACGSSGSTSGSGASATPTSAATAIDTKPGQGVSADAIKLGVMLIDFNCIKQFVDQLRPEEQNAYKVYIDDINAKGGVNGRTIVPYIRTYCPTNNTGALTACTSLTEDEKVFAVIGIFYDPTGDTQLCFAKDHKTPVVADSITEDLVAKAPAGLLVSPNISAERRLRVIMQLVQQKGVLAGKKVAWATDAPNKPRASKVVGDALKGLGVERGTDASLLVNGSDTTTAQAQLDSFIERWKTDGTNALILVGSAITAKQFVEKIKAAIPDMLLIADTTSILDAGREEQKAGVKPNPYDGAISAEGQTGIEHMKTEHFRFCRDIWEKATGKKVPSPNVVVPLPNGKQNDIYGAVEDACVYTHFFATIAQHVGRNLNSTNWTQTVNAFGPIDDTSTVWASLRAGKYDADDTYGLVAFDPSVGEAGDWKHVTPVQNVTGS